MGWLPGAAWFSESLLKAPPILLLVDRGQSPLRLKNLEAIECAFPDAELRILSLTDADAVLPAKSVAYSGLADHSAVDRALEGRSGEVLVALHGFSPHEILPLAWLWAFAARGVRDVVRFYFGADGQLQKVPHRPLSGSRARVLSVFPGAVVPAQMGSHQRAFGVLAYLNRNGVPTDALITAPNELDKNKAIALLSQICPSVHTYRDKRRKAPRKLRIRKALERRYRALRGGRGAPPDLFEERLANKATYSGRKRLRQLLVAEDYEHVVINYAWMEPIRELVPASRRRKVQWLCDTHDVQFVRGATNNASEPRLAVSMEREKELELKVLRSFDRVIAISDADRAVLDAYLPPGAVVCATSGFDYARADPREVDVLAPRFGFIGGSMDANVKALRCLLESWWPAIRAQWPSATLHLAGRVCTMPGVAQAALLSPGVVLLGAVSSLRSYYRSIDVMLNPVVVRGGLNFKSVEAVMAGCLLVTTPLGAECLGDSTLAVVANSVEDVVAGLEEEFSLEGEYKSRRSAVQARADARFSDAKAYHALREVLRSPGGVTRRTTRHLSPDNSVVLIQAGDHFENWCRVLPLAQGVKQRGYAPVVLLYGRAGLPFFLSHGVDAACLYDFNEARMPRMVRLLRAKAHSGLAARYRGFDLEDLVAVDLAKRAGKGKLDERAVVKDITRHIDRVLRLLEHVRPGAVFVWNGYTGSVANILRQYAANCDIPSAFLERSLFPDGVFVDPDGANGYSGLSRMSLSELFSVRPGCSTLRSFQDACPPVSPAELEELKAAGPWRSHDRIVLVPLQVQRDTNLLLHSPVVKSGSDLLARALAVAKSEDAMVVVRPHPEEVDAVELPKVPGYVQTSRGRLDAWLELASHVVTINSTVGLEALFRGKRVTAFGRSIYGSKGFDVGMSSPRDEVECYFDVLVGRHTALPGHVPTVLAEVLPERSPAVIHPRNPLDLDPEQSGLEWESVRSQVRRKAIAARQLTVALDLRSDVTLNLTYRRLNEAVTATWLEERIRTQFDLDESIEVRLVGTGATSGASGAAVWVSDKLTGNRSPPTLDPYGSLQVMNLECK
jgi:polysaccharide biosynthesis protein PslH